MSVLPDDNDAIQVIENFEFLVRRSLVKFLPSLKLFQKTVPKHIVHDFKQEMSKKSEVVSVLFFQTF